MVLTVRSGKLTTSSHPPRLLIALFSDKFSKEGGNARTTIPCCGRTIVLLLSPSFLNFLANFSGLVNLYISLELACKIKTELVMSTVLQRFKTGKEN